MKRITLSPHDTVPDAPMLARMVEQARAARENLIALPFEGIGGGRFVLAVTFSSSKRDIPRWYLFAGENDGAPLVWVRDTANREEIALILSGRSSGNTAETQKPKAVADGLLQPAGFDQDSYYQFYQRLIDPDTNIFPSGAFYWFLSQEIVRYQRTKAPFSLIMIRPMQPLSPPDKDTLAWLGQLLTGQMRKLDYVCGINGNLGILLAASDLEEGVSCAKRLNLLVSERSARRNPEAGLTLFGGVASVPETSEHPGVLISAAEVALRSALATGIYVSAFEPSMVAAARR